MEYTAQEIADAVERFGELFVVLDSGKEYQIHGTASYEISDGIIQVEGLHSGEYIIVEFPLDTIEHYYTHKEV